MDDRMELVEQRTLAESRLKECNESQYEKAEFKKKIYDLQEKVFYYYYDYLLDIIRALINKVYQNS